MWKKTVGPEANLPYFCHINSKHSMADFEYLFYLQNQHIIILEIKRKDLSNDAPAEDRFKWLWIERSDNSITKLDFCSMDNSREIQERYFDQGYLKFNDKTGTFIEKYNSAQHSLERCDPAIEDDVIHQLIVGFLSSH